MRLLWFLGYICMYIYVCLFNLRHTPPAIEREISSGGAVGRFGNEPAQAPRLVFLGGGVIFESLVGREWGSRRRPISPQACSSDRGLLRLTSQTPGVGCTHSVRSPGSPRRGKVEDKCQQRLLSMPCLEPATFRLYIFVSKHLPTLQKHRPSSQKCFST